MLCLRNKDKAYSEQVVCISNCVKIEFVVKWWYIIYFGCKGGKIYIPIWTNGGFLWKTTTTIRYG